VLTSGQSVMWQLIDAVPSDARTELKMRELLLAKLSRMPIPRVATFQRELLDCMEQVLSWELWEAADVIHGAPCSGDAFADFRLWVVAQGGEKFQEILRNPDSLASIHEVVRITRLPQPWSDADYPHFSSLGTVANDAFEAVVAKLRPDVAESLDRPAVFDEQIQAYLASPFPADYGVDAAVHIRLPRLSALRGWSL
jgi:hypothetical protein